MQRVFKFIPHRQTRSVNVFQEFANSVKRQVEENKKFQQDVKLLGEQQQKVGESGLVKGAQKTINITSQATQKVFGAVGSAVNATLETKAAQATGKAITKTAEIVSDVAHKV